MSERSLDRLAGDLKVSPGLARPHNLLSTRPDFMDALTQGQPATALPQTLASLFSLCGHAHRLCAGMAVQATQGEVEPLDNIGLHALQTETLREHLRRISLDWPLQLAANHSDRERLQGLALQALRTCPLSMSGSASPIALSAMPSWLSQQLLGLPAHQWLAGWERDPRAWMNHWCATTLGWLPQLLQDGKAVAEGAIPGAAALRVHATDHGLRVLAADLRDTPQFSRQPVWQGHCAETGPWTRLNQTAPERFDTPWLRLGARLAELVRLSLPNEAGRTGVGWLQAGSLSVGENEGLAWVEMARGLLIHYVRVGNPGANASTLRCRVLAPTEWNFHPQGAVAQVLESLPKDTTPDAQRRILALMTAFDPCVQFDILPTHSSAEKTHA